QAHRIEQQNLVIQAKLGFAYANYANAKTCRYSDLSPTRKAVQFLQTGHQLEKGNPYIHAELADLYGLMGMYPLSLREARKAYSMDSNPYFTYSLVVSLVDSGRLEESLQYYNKLPEQKADMIMEMFYRHAAVGKWQQAITYRDRYLAKGKVDNLYDALMIDIVTKKLNADIAQQYSYEQLVASLQLTPWEHTVNQFWLGQMDAAGLISEATDVCMTAEAEFYMGAKAYLSGDHQQAVTHFEKVLATKTYNFVEFALAKQLLKEL
ncbi:MAG: hypothetical protein MI976_02855, partial [Pseudomonadales bacterium]|nr:hypothetical protein [Pseudomonadales bacterium]